MKRFLSDSAVTLQVSLVDRDGNEVSATACEYRVVDEDGEEIVARQAVPGFVPGTTATVTVPGASNALDAGEVRGLREIQLFATTSEGVVPVSESYMIEAAEQLVEGANSFQTLGSATLVAASLENLDAWNAADREARINAMVEARRRIGRMRFRFAFADPMDVVDPTWAVYDLLAITQDQWAALDPGFMEALKYAQVIEANEVLGGDSVERKRREGLMSLTVGESSQMYRPGKPLMLPICRRAAEYLSKYIEWTVKVGRVG